MPSLNLDLDFFGHPKVAQLRALTGCPTAEVYILRLWCWIGKFHPQDGQLLAPCNFADLPTFFESIMDWRGEPKKLFAALIQCRFVVRKLDSRYKGDATPFFVNDWLKHSGHIWQYHCKAIENNKKRWNEVRKQKQNQGSPTRTPDRNPPAVQGSAGQCRADLKTGPTGETAGIQKSGTTVQTARTGTTGTTGMPQHITGSTTANGTVGSNPSATNGIAPADPEASDALQALLRWGRIPEKQCRRYLIALNVGSKGSTGGYGNMWLARIAWLMDAASTATVKDPVRYALTCVGKGREPSDVSYRTARKYMFEQELRSGPVPIGKVEL